MQNVHKLKKYSGTGNTFLIVDNRNGELNLSEKLAWSEICRDHDVDGLLFVCPSDGYDFKMRYLNADGGEVGMCGNGGRSISHFFHHSLEHKTDLRFETQNAVYESIVENNNVSLRMTEFREENAISIDDFFPELSTGLRFYGNTGVPHCVFEVEDITKINLEELGKLVRYDSRFSEGVNCNFFHREPDGLIYIRTYERGVEGETLSCGTGATALAWALHLENGITNVDIVAPGGRLNISFQDGIKKTFLSGEVMILDDSISVTFGRGCYV